MAISRRAFLADSLAGAAVYAGLSAHALGQDAATKLRLSACDWSLSAPGPEGLATAKAVGLDGIEVSAGKPADTLDIARPDYRQKYKDAMAETGLVVSSVAMGFLNNAPLASDPRGPAWLEQTIEAAGDLEAKVILLAFFGKGDLRDKLKLKKDDVDVVVERLKEAAPRAEKAGVILGLENTLSAKQNAAILDRVQSNAVKIYYDVGNSTYNLYSVPEEIRWLADRICQFHFKDGAYYLGEGKVKMEPVAEAIHDIGYGGWLVLETSVPSKDRDADFTKNAAYVRKLMGIA